MPSLFQIVTNTPLWVWPLMAAVVALGLYGLRPRTVPLIRLAILPLVASVRPPQHAVGQPVLPGAGGSWLCSSCGRSCDRPPPQVRRRGWPLELAGGWFMLLFGLSIFAARHALGVLFGVMPAPGPAPGSSSRARSAGDAGIGLGWLPRVVRARGASTSRSGDGCARRRSHCRTAHRGWRGRSRAFDLPARYRPRRAIRCRASRAGILEPPWSQGHGARRCAHLVSSSRPIAWSC